MTTKLTQFALPVALLAALGGCVNTQSLYVRQSYLPVHSNQDLPSGEGVVVELPKATAIVDVLAGMCILDYKNQRPQEHFNIVITLVPNDFNGFRMGQMWGAAMNDFGDGAIFDAAGNRTDIFANTRPKILLNLTAFYEKLGPQARRDCLAAYQQVNYILQKHPILDIRGIDPHAPQLLPSPPPPYYRPDW